MSPDQYASKSITENWITMIQNEGGETPTSFGLGELMRAYADAEGGGGGSGWPEHNGTGPGNLTAETPMADTVGYQMTDQGTGGISISTTNASGPGLGLSSVSGMGLTDDSAGGIAITENGVGSINLNCSSDGEVIIQSNGTGGVAISSTGTLTGTGIDITTSGTITGNGIVILDHASASLLLQQDGANDGNLRATIAAGSGAIQLVNEGTGGMDIEPGSGGMTGVLTHLAGHLASDYNLTTGLATFLTTGSLTTGTWLVSMSAFVESGTGGDVNEFTVNNGTATATFEGQCSAQFACATATLQGPGITLNFVATVTSGGTLVFQGITNSTSGTPVVKAATGTNSYTKATGYTAVRIA
jgi:hypothetical protein